MAEADRVRTVVRNRVGTRRFSWIPPNGRILNFDEQVSIPGVLETTVYLGMSVEQLDEYVDDVINDRVEVTKLGFGGTGEVSDVFQTTVGNGSATVFEIDAGFATSNAEVFLYDLINQNTIALFGLDLATPNPTSITLELTPAPASGQIQVFIFG